MDMYIGIATKMIIGSIGIFMLMRLIGKKAISELTPFDILYVIILGAIVEEAIYDDKVSVLHVIFAIVLWGLFVFGIEKAIAKTVKLSSIIEGEPAILIAKGRLNMKELEANYMDIEQLRSMLRQNDVYSINDVYYAILEVNGSMTIITKKENIIPSFLLVEFGVIQEKTLRSLLKDEEWLRTNLVEKGYPDLNKIVYCEWLPDENELVVETYANTINEKLYIDD